MLFLDDALPIWQGYCWPKRLPCGRDLFQATPVLWSVRRRSLVCALQLDSGRKLRCEYRRFSRRELRSLNYRARRGTSEALRTYNPTTSTGVELSVVVPLPS